MKKSIVAALVLAACLLLAPFGFGKLAEKRVNAGLDTLLEQMPFLVITERSWQGGWFKSSQEVRFGLSPAVGALMNPQAMQAAIEQSMAAAGVAADEGVATPDEPAPGAEGEQPSAEEQAPPAAMAAMPGFTVHNEVLHGPVLGAGGFGLARVDTTFVVPEEIATQIRRYFGPDPALQVRSRVGFFSGGSTTLTSEGRTIKAEVGDNELTYETAKLVLGYGSNLDTYDAQGELPRLQVKAGQGADVLLTNMTLDADGRRVMGELYDGEFAFELGELQASNAGQDYTVANLHYISGVRTDDGYTTMSGRFGSGAVQAKEISAIGLDIQEIHYDMSFRHLHAETVEKMIVAMRDFYTKLPADGNAEAMAAAMQTGFLEPLKVHAEELLRHDPELGFDRVGIVTTDGEGVLKGVIRLVGASAADFSVVGMMGLIGKIEADFTFEIAQTLVDKIPNAAMVVGMAVGQGFAVREGDKLVCHVEFKGGELKINGKVQQIPPGVLPGTSPAPPMPAAGA
jgi:uncharacterized protein YdgA (DUF945 family)